MYEICLPIKRIFDCVQQNCVLRFCHLNTISLKHPLHTLRELYNNLYVSGITHVVLWRKYIYADQKTESVDECFSQTLRSDRKFNSVQKIFYNGFKNFLKKLAPKHITFFLIQFCKYFWKYMFLNLGNFLFRIKFSIKS